MTIKHYLWNYQEDWKHHHYRQQTMEMLPSLISKKKKLFVQEEGRKRNGERKSSSYATLFPFFFCFVFALVFPFHWSSVINVSLHPSVRFFLLLDVLFQLFNDTQLVAMINGLSNASVTELKN